MSDFIGEDGLPNVGARINAGDPLYSVYDITTGKANISRYKGEPATITKVGPGRSVACPFDSCHSAPPLPCRRCLVAAAAHRLLPSPGGDS